MSDDTSAWNAIMQYSFLHVFANDGTIDAEELAMLEKLAMSDGVVDERERSVLSGIFARVSQDTTTPETWAAICDFKSRFAIP